MRYSIESDPDISARAQALEVNISPKHSVEICREIRGMELQKAKDYLQEVIELRRPIPFKRHTGKVSHRKGKGFGPGRYPQKAASKILLPILSQRLSHNSRCLAGLATNQSSLRPG